MTIQEVLREVEHHLELGAKEVVLTGVDVTSWGHDLPDTPPLGALVEAVLNHFPALDRLRMSSLDGIEIDEVLFELFASQERLMPHLHLSMQHGHDLILKRMKRRHLRANAVDLVGHLKARRSDLSIGADIIAGFPTETNEHHEANLSIIEELDIVHGHIFPYSPRPGTPAARMPQLERGVVKARAAELREAVKARRAAWLQSLVGETLPVLAERDGTGYAPNYARVQCPSSATTGEIIALTPQSLKGGMLV